MIRRFAEHRLTKPAARERRPAGNRVIRFMVLCLGAGAVAALLAIVIALLPALIVLAFPTQPMSEIEAGTLFPTPSPVQRVIDVYDPAPVAPRPPATEPPDRTTPGSTPSPEPGDGGGGGGD